MSRDFATSALVQLPVLDAYSSYTLGNSLITAADHALAHPPRGVKVPDELPAARDALKAAVDGLVPMLKPRKAAPPDVQRSLDHRVDRACRALYHWLYGLSLLPDQNASRGLAQQVFDRVFDEGLGFINLAFKVEWAHVDVRLKWIKDEHLDRIIDQLGGTAFLKELREANKAYGDALGVSDVKELDPESPQLRPQLETVLAALRAYVLEAAPLANRKEPARAVGLALLRPLAEWESTVATRGTGASTATGDTPDAGATGAAAADADAAAGTPATARSGS
jgi:hypothetical protein